MPIRIHVPTFNWHVPLRNEWRDTWEEWFTRQFRSDIAWEQSARGADSEFNTVADEFLEKVIPRLLRPLESNGRSIKPTLVHGDVWHENVQVNGDTGRVVLFDACCSYVHCESKSYLEIVIGRG
jgi:fructosamine-3-kinase